MATFATVDNTNLQAKEMGNEIILSYSEHLQIIGDSGWSPLVAGDFAQDKGLWRAMQIWLVAHCGDFVNHNDAPNVFTEATWLSTAGLNASGFSRYKDGALLGYGNIAYGDDRCIVNFQELQKGFDALRWTKKDVTWTAKGENNYKQGTSYGDTWAEAKTAAENLYNASEETAFPHGVRSGGTPLGDGFNAELERTYGYIQVTDIVDIIQHSGALWLKPKNHTGSTVTFDANGDIVGSEGVWGEEFTFAESSSTSHEQLVGSLDMPNWCQAPTHTPATYPNRGWLPDEETFIMKWNGANGFSYTL